MSSNGQQAPVSDPNPSLDGVFSSIRTLCVALGGILAAKGLETSGLYFWVEMVSSSIMILGPAAWGVYSAISKALKSRKAITNAVAAGMVAGASRVGAVAPSSLTHCDASEIIKTYAPGGPEH